MTHFESVIALRPDHAEAHNNLGGALWKQDKREEAARQFQRALALRPDFAEALNNLGGYFVDREMLDEAIARFEQALALRPDYPEALNNLGKALLQLDQTSEAMARFEQAIALRPDYPDALATLGACYLAQGDYERGWPRYEARMRLPGLEPLSELPRWTGQPLAGRTLLLVSEQGLGDTLHFVRYARRFKAMGARVVMAAPPVLGRLLASCADFDELYLLGSTVEFISADFYLPLLSAPAALGTDATSIPCDVPYLSANPGLVERWRQELAPVDGFRIGIVWQGSRRNDGDRFRSMALAHFAPLAKLPGVRLVSLQKGFGSEQVAQVDFPVLDFSDRLDEAAGPFMDSAAVIRNLDLVVAADTSTAHLAGALGAPIFLAISYSPDWRWLLDRDDSPWYPTMRLFRQTKHKLWPEVFERIAAAVQALREESGSQSR